MSGDMSEAAGEQLAMDSLGELGWYPAQGANLIHVDGRGGGHCWRVGWP